MPDNRSPLSDPHILETGYQAAKPATPPSPTGGTANDEFRDLLEEPSFERVFRVESESSLFERIRQEFLQRHEKDRPEFPVGTPLADKVLAARRFPMRVEYYVPLGVSYGPLYFEDKNTERNGWDLGAYEPFVQAAMFYVDLIKLPYNMAVLPPWAWENSAGYVLPGEPLPYFIYVPPCSWTGFALEAGAIAAVMCFFGI